MAGDVPSSGLPSRENSLLYQQQGVKLADNHQLQPLPDALLLQGSPSQWLSTERYLGAMWDTSNEQSLHRAPQQGGWAKLC